MIQTPNRGLLALAILVGHVGCRTQPEAYSPGTNNGSPGPDTTFYQEASWWPDGSKLVLSRLDIHDDYRTTIAVINADGTGYAPLTEGPGDMWTSASPDGARIAYASTREGNRDIYVMKSDGTASIRLTHNVAEDTHPDWSPDGERIVFVSNRDTVSHIYVMQVDGSRQSRISTTAEEKWNPRWSPDGHKIVYYGAEEPGQDSIYVMNADGTQRMTVGRGIWPSWSASGSALLFVDDKDVFEISADGNGRKKLLQDVVIARWSPDGTMIAFVRVTWRAPEGWPATSDVFVVRADGSGQMRVTGN